MSPCAKTVFYIIHRAMAAASTPNPPSAAVEHRTVWSRRIEKMIRGMTAQELAAFPDLLCIRDAHK